MHILFIRASLYNHIIEDLLKKWTFFLKKSLKGVSLQARPKIFPYQLKLELSECMSKLKSELFQNQVPIKWELKLIITLFEWTKLNAKNELTVNINLNYQLFNQFPIILLCFHEN